MDEKQQTNDEVDVFELFRYIGRGFHNLGNLFLRLFNFLVGNILIIGILLVIGLVAGYFIDKATPEIRKTEALVVSNFGSAEYLYTSIGAMESKLKHSEAGFLKEMGLTKKETRRIFLEIAPVISVHNITEEEQAFLELLKDNESLNESQKQAIINRSYPHHRITLFHPENVNAEKLIRRIIEHLRQNSHYTEVFNQRHENLQHRIKSNLFILSQIDTLFQNYGKSVGNSEALKENLVYSNTLNLGELLKTKMRLQSVNSDLITRSVENTTFLKVINVNSASAPKHIPLSSKTILFLPLLLIGLFFLVHLLMYINKKAVNLK